MGGSTRSARPPTAAVSPARAARPGGGSAPSQQFEADHQGCGAEVLDRQRVFRRRQRSGEGERPREARVDRLSQRFLQRPALPGKIVIAEALDEPAHHGETCHRHVVVHHRFVAAVDGGAVSRNPETRDVEAVHHGSFVRQDRPCGGRNGQSGVRSREDVEPGAPDRAIREIRRRRQGAQHLRVLIGVTRQHPHASRSQFPERTVRCRQRVPVGDQETIRGDEPGQDVVGVRLRLDPAALDPHRIGQTRWRSRFVDLRDGRRPQLAPDFRRSSAC